MIHTVKGFSVVNEAEVGVGLEFPCFFYDPMETITPIKRGLIFKMLVICLQKEYPRFPTWRRQWHPTPVLLPGKSHGRRSLVGCSPWGR